MTSREEGGVGGGCKKCLKRWGKPRAWRSWFASVVFDLALSLEKFTKLLKFMCGELVTVLVEKVDECGGGVAVEDAGEEGTGFRADDGVSGDVGFVEVAKSSPSCRRRLFFLHHPFLQSRCFWVSTSCLF